MSKVRADQRLVELGLAENRSKAKAMIMTGRVLYSDRVVAKAGEMVPPDAVLALKKQGQEFVSRGGGKLAGALKDFGLDVSGFRALDVGASTGGFTDCLLKNGVDSVAAVDVGYGLIDWRLRQDERVTVVERTNARHLTADQVGDAFDLAVIDVSFISIIKVLPAVSALIRAGGAILAMVKPQFEVGREKVGKGGVVRDPEAIAEAVGIVEKAAELLGLTSKGCYASHVKGPKGNQEQFVLFRKAD